LGADVKEHERVFDQFKKNIISYFDAKKHLINLWKRTSNNNKDFFKKIFESVRLKNDAEEIINIIKSKNIIVCLITGGVDLYAQIIGKRLKISEYYANTKLIWDENNILIDFEYDRNQGNKKLSQLKEFCIKYKVNPIDCFTVGDDENDIEVFKLTKHGIAVKSPNSYIVEPYAWKVIKTLSELKELI